MAETLPLRVLVACEYSGRVRDAFRFRGHDAMSADLLPTEVPGPHYEGDVLDIIESTYQEQKMKVTAEALRGLGLRAEADLMDHLAKAWDSVSEVEFTRQASAARTTLVGTVAGFSAGGSAAARVTAHTWTQSPHGRLRGHPLPPALLRSAR